MPALCSNGPSVYGMLCTLIVSMLFALTAGLNTNARSIDAAVLAMGVAAFAACLGLGIARVLRQRLPLDLATLLGLALLLQCLAVAVVALRWHPGAGVIALLPLAVLGSPQLLRDEPEDWWPLVLFSVVGFSLAWTLEGSLRVASFEQDGIMRAWSDVLLHAITVAEQGDPRTVPRVNAAMAGVPTPFYHFASYAMPALFVRWLDITPIAAVTGIWLPLGIAMMALALAALGRELAGVAGGALAIILLAALPLGAGQFFGHGFLSFHWLLDTAPGTGYGCATALLSVALLARHLREGSRSMLLLSLLAMILTVLMRVQIFGWLAPAWIGTIVLASPVLPRRLRLPLLALGAALGLALLIWLVWGELSRDGTETVLFRYFDFLRGGEEGSFYRMAADWLRTTPPSFLALPGLALLALVAPAPWLAFALLALTSLAARRRRLEAIDVLPFLLAPWVMVVMTLAPTPPHGDFTEYRHRGFPIVVLIHIAWVARLALRSFSWTGARSGGAGIAAQRGLAVAACLAGIVTWWNAPNWKRPTMAWAQEMLSYSVPLPLHAAARWLRDHSRPGNIFALAEPNPDANLMDRGVDLMALSGVPVFASRAGYYRTLGPSFAAESSARLAFLRGVAADEPKLALARLHERGVAYYVVLDGMRPQWNAQAPEAAFSAEGVTIFRTVSAR